MPTSLRLLRSASIRFTRLQHLANGGDRLVRRQPYRRFLAGVPQCLLPCMRVGPLLCPAVPVPPVDGAGLQQDTDRPSVYGPEVRTPLSFQYLATSLDDESAKSTVCSLCVAAEIEVRSNLSHGNLVAPEEAGPDRNAVERRPTGQRDLTDFGSFTAPDLGYGTDRGLYVGFTGIKYTAGAECFGDK